MDPTSANFTLSRDQLLKNLEASQLLSPEDFQRILAGDHPGAIGLANALVESGLLTAYQIDLIGQGKPDHLRVGNYEILGRLGAGGMGTVFKARHRRMKRIVALKVLSAELCQDPTFVQRFQREVETVARLSHPNVVMAYDADEAEVGHFLVMEFVNGRDLASVVDDQGPLSVQHAIDYLLQSAHGLAYAHEQGIIHRDIKPHNLLLDQSGTVKVTDLGLARLASSTPGAVSNLTQAGGLLGTSNYMPPEQAADPSLTDLRADIYSLGCTLHFLLTGSPPYTGASMMSVLIKHRESPPPSLRAARPDVPEALEQLFHRMLAKSPEDRPANMTEVIKALEPMLDRASTMAPGRLGQPIPAGKDSTATGAVAQNTVSAVDDAFAVSVLVVEPSRVQGSIIRKYLEAQDVIVKGVVANGEEALKAVRAEPPVCVVSAFHLPDMTGLELAQRIRRELQAAAPGFVLVSSEDDSAGDSLTQFSRAMMLHKPFTPRQLIQAVNVVTGRSVRVKASSIDVSVARPQAAPPRPMVDRSRLHVLIVDDSNAARLNARKVLESLGFAQFTEAADGAQAVSIISTALNPFDLVVTDYNMPYMDGRGLIAYLKHEAQMGHVPILMVTTETDPAVLQAVRSLGVAGLFEKTFPLAEVRTVIDRLF